MAKKTVISNMIKFVPAKGKAIMCRIAADKLVTKSGKVVYTGYVR